MGRVQVTSTGALVAALALGVRDALAARGRRERPPIVHEADDPWPRTGEPVELHVERRPDDSWVVIRPWLLRPAASTD